MDAPKVCSFLQLMCPLSIRHIHTLKGCMQAVSNRETALTPKPSNAVHDLAGKTDQHTQLSQCITVLRQKVLNPKPYSHHGVPCAACNHSTPKSSMLLHAQTCRTMHAWGPCLLNPETHDKPEYGRMQTSGDKPGNACVAGANRSLVLWHMNLPNIRCVSCCSSFLLRVSHATLRLGSTQVLPGLPTTCACLEGMTTHNPVLKS
jgi:hypothetical protein